MPIQISAVHAVEWSGFLWLCQCDFADVMTAYESFLEPVLLLHFKLNPFLNFTKVFWRASIKYTVQYINSLSELTPLH